MAERTDCVNPHRSNGLVVWKCQTLPGRGGQCSFVAARMCLLRPGPSIMLLPRSTSFWLSVGKGLIDFFGGKMDYNDSDDIEINYSKPIGTWG